MSRRWRRPLAALAILGAAFVVGSSVQQQLGISFSLEHLEEFRLWVQDLGWWGHVVFLLIMIFRLFIGLSSHLVLILGGIVFGVTGGIVWGSLGLVLSALVLYGLATMLGADWVERRFGDRHASVLVRIQRFGVPAIFAVTAHPFGLLTPAHLAAGLVGLDAGPFALSVVLAAPVRAAPYALLGTAILDLTPAQTLAITAALVLVFVLPLLHPAVRAWVRGTPEVDPG